jgi:hypothetical protein
MQFAASKFIPGEAMFESYLDEMRQYASAACTRHADEVLEEFFEFPVAAREHHIAGIHHVALYIGDYRTEAEVERWLEFLRHSHFVSDVECGPSYISPREYGTQGYWISCTLDGAPVEMFSSRNAGPWRGYDQHYKITRMSHFALSVPQALHLLPLLTYFAHYRGVLILSYSKEDVLGHTYGHLLNQNTDCVIELTHSELPDIASRDAVGAGPHKGQGGPHG